MLLRQAGNCATTWLDAQTAKTRATTDQAQGQQDRSATTDPPKPVLQQWSLSATSSLTLYSDILQAIFSYSKCDASQSQVLPE